MSNQNARQARDREELRAADSAWRANSLASRSPVPGTNEFSAETPPDSSDTAPARESPAQPALRSSQSLSGPLDARNTRPDARGAPAPRPGPASNPTNLGDRLTVIGANENFSKWISWNEFLVMLRSGEVL